MRTLPLPELCWRQTVPAEIIGASSRDVVPGTAFTVTEELEYGATYLWKVKAVQPVESEWSTLANFTVKEQPVDAVPPVPVIVQQVPPPVINVPEPPPGNTITFSPPPVTPAPVVPDYLRVAIIMASILLLAVIALIFKPFNFRPSRRVAEGFQGPWGKLREGLVAYIHELKPGRILQFKWYWSDSTWLQGRYGCT